MAFGLQSFKIRQALGEWAENSVINYFKTTPSAEILAFPYGERWGGKRKKEPTDASSRPDLLLVDREKVRNLVGKGVDLSQSNLLEMKDSDPQMQFIVSNSLAALEVKISFRYYEEGHVNFIIDEVRKAHYNAWRSRVYGIEDLVAWFTLDKAFITTMDDILENGKPEKRSYENRGKMSREKLTWNLPVEGKAPFCEVTNVDLNKTLRVRMERNASGSIAYLMEDDLAILKHVNLDALKKLAAETLRGVPTSRRLESAQSETVQSDQQKL